MNKLGWPAALLLLVLVVLATRDSVATSRKADSLAVLVDAAAHTRDTILARNAEREVRDAKHADSLRQLVKAYRRKTATVITRADTVLLPIQEFVYVTDTLIPACTVCASRLDSAVAASRRERAATDTLTDYLRRENEAVRHYMKHQAFTKTLLKFAVPTAFVLGFMVAK